MRLVRWIAVVVAFVPSAFGQTIQTIEKTEGRVIVAFQAVPAAQGGARAAAATRDLLNRFRSDVGRIQHGASILSAGHSSHAAIRHEYSVTFAGAAIDATPDVIDAVSRLSYVRRVYADTIV